MLQTLSNELQHFYILLFWKISESIHFAMKRYGRLAKRHCRVSEPQNVVPALRNDVVMTFC